MRGYINCIHNISARQVASSDYNIRRIGSDFMKLKIALIYREDNAGPKDLCSTPVVITNGLDIFQQF